MKICNNYLSIKNKLKKKNTQAIASVGRDMEKREPLCTVGKKANYCSHYGKQYGGSSEN